MLFKVLLKSGKFMVNGLQEKRDSGEVAGESAVFELAEKRSNRHHAASGTRPGTAVGDGSQVRQDTFLMREANLAQLFAGLLDVHGDQLSEVLDGAA